MPPVPTATKTPLPYAMPLRSPSTPGLVSLHLVPSGEAKTLSPTATNIPLPKVTLSNLLFVYSDCLVQVIPSREV